MLAYWISAEIKISCISDSCVQKGRRAESHKVFVDVACRCCSYVSLHLVCVVCVGLFSRAAVCLFVCLYEGSGLFQETLLFRLEGVFWGGQ